MSKKEAPSIFFPEPMNYIEIISPLDSAYHCIKAIARLGNVQLLDKNENNIGMQKRYTDTYMQCEEAERSLRFIEMHLKNTTQDNGEIMLPNPPKYHNYKEYIKDLNLIDILQEIQEADTLLHEKVSIYQQLVQQNRQRTKRLEALRFYRPIIEQESLGTDHVDINENSMELSMLGDNSIVSSITGFVPIESLHRLMVTVYRVSRHSVIQHIGESDGTCVAYSLFTSSSTILDKIRKIAESFSPDVFEFPSDLNSLHNEEQVLVQQIEQQNGVDDNAVSVNKSILTDLAQKYWRWKIFIAQEKQIYMALDFGDFERAASTVVYNGWCPTRMTSKLLHACVVATQESGSAIAITCKAESAESLIEKNENLPYDERKEIVIPTFIEKNEFTTAFQMLNNAYGVPNYDELNGGAFYGMYPFLFAIMFGDIGHSIFYILAAISLLILDPLAKKNNWNLGEMGGSIFKFKWLLFFASFCSLYTGFLYNETFGLAIDFFGSHYEIDNATSTDGMKYWKKTGRSVYAFGIDPVWAYKDNELIFTNSFKMKLSVVMGMCQMVFGMFLSLINHIHRHDVKEIILKWIPEMMYLVPFFGYLVVIILKKWMTDFSTFPTDNPIDGRHDDGVNLIQIMIGMILSLGSKDINLELYPSQWGNQLIIVIIFFISIPYLLFVKPIFECVHLHGTPDFNVLEIFVMNLIGVIEFCLGALSHTASYLRLWALSLAHSELSQVIYNELFLMTLNTHNVVLLFIGFAAFAALTVCILLAMEAFSALLHAIRLMWVEFSSKFYGGMGTAFKPLSLKKAFSSIGVK